MPDDLMNFKGAMPYSSELFGTFQPLLGWKSRLKSKRFSINAIDSVAKIISKMEVKGEVLQALKKNPNPIDPEDIALSQTVPRSLRSEAVFQLQRYVAKECGLLYRGGRIG